MFRAKTNDGPLVVTSSGVMWRPKGSENNRVVGFETLARCQLTEHKGKKVVFSHKSLPRTLP